MRKVFKSCALISVVFLTWPLSPLRGAAKPQVWIVSWAASQQVPEPNNALPSDDLRDATVRQIFHLSAGGSVLHVHVSNAFGTAALHLSSVHIAHPVTLASAAIDPATDRALTFSGSQDVTIPPGAEYISDRVEYSVRALSDLTVTFYLEVPPATQTGHPGSRARSRIHRRAGRFHYRRPRSHHEWQRSLDRCAGCSPASCATDA